MELIVAGMVKVEVQAVQQAHAHAVRDNYQLPCDQSLSVSFHDHYAASSVYGCVDV